MYGGRVLVALLLYAALAAAAPANQGGEGSEQKSSGRSIIEAAKKHLEELRAAAPKRPDGGVGPREKVIEFDIIVDEEGGVASDVGEQTLRRRPADAAPAAAVPAAADGQTLVRQRRKAVRHEGLRWPNARVPYEIDRSIDEISPQARLIIQSAMQHWEALTCVRFERYEPTKHTNWLTLRKGQWCASKLGMVGGVQPLYLASGCLRNGTVVHELGHTLGWIHEQARPDRDDHVQIKWDLISAAYKAQYNKHEDSFIDTHSVPYDYRSIMHYPSYGEIITRDANMQTAIGQRERLSFYDVKLANLMYKCAERNRCDLNAVECDAGGYVGPNCKCTCPDGTDSCTIRNDIGGAQPPATTPRSCNEWTTHEGAYISGMNDDVITGITVDECKARCRAATGFRCASIDYWRERRQCYLSVAARSTVGVQLSRDPRMTYYERNLQCGGGGGGRANAGPLVISSDWPRRRPLEGQLGASAAAGSSQPSSEPPRGATAPAGGAGDRPSTAGGGGGCRQGAWSIGGACVSRASAVPRPAHVAALECNTKHGGASLWNFSRSLLDDRQLPALIDGGSDGYWIQVADYKSTNPLASFFDFCPYLIREGERIVIRDNYCHRKKGFLCAL